MSANDSKPAKPKPDEMPDIWAHLEEQGVEIERRKTREYNLSPRGKHYFEVEDMTRRSIVCTSCAIPHGYRLGAQELVDYNLLNGVLFYKGQPLNTTP